ncbi:MAG: DUF427 domain-containing protein [Halieaceae bacterium]
MIARWNDQIIAESEATVVVEGNHYFPLDSVSQEYLHSSDHTSVCGWKGTAHYYSLDVGGDVNKDAVWYYPEPKSAAAEIAGHVAFWKGVKVSQD